MVWCLYSSFDHGVSFTPPTVCTCRVYPFTSPAVWTCRVYLSPPPVPEFIDPVFVKTSPKRSFSMIEKERFGLVLAKSGSINAGTAVWTCRVPLFTTTVLTCWVYPRPHACSVDVQGVYVTLSHL
jgi:hypothetical protein